MVLWEAFCTVFVSDRPTILAEFLNFFLCRRRRTQVEHHQNVASILHNKMDEFTSMRNANTHFWSERTWSHGNVSQLSLWDVEESSSGPQGFVPKPGASVVFFADHTLTIGPGAKVATVLLMRVGDLSKEAAVELATVDGTAEAGYSFKASKQTVCFDAGAASAEFHVELLPSSHCVTHRFFVVHATAVYSNVAMGSSSFTRVRLLPVGLWPPGVQLEDVQAQFAKRWLLAICMLHV